MIKLSKGNVTESQPFYYTGRIHCGTTSHYIVNDQTKNKTVTRTLHVGKSIVHSNSERPTVSLTVGACSAGEGPQDNSTWRSTYVKVKLNNGKYTGEGNFTMEQSNFKDGEMAWTTTLPTHYYNPVSERVDPLSSWKIYYYASGVGQMLYAKSAKITKGFYVKATCKGKSKDSTEATWRLLDAEGNATSDVSYTGFPNWRLSGRREMYKMVLYREYSNTLYADPESAYNMDETNARYFIRTSNGKVYDTGTIGQGVEWDGKDLINGPTFNNVLL